MKNKYYFLILLLSISCFYNYGQESHGGTPITFNSKTSSMQKAPTFICKKELPTLDNELEKINAEKAEESMGFQKNKFYGKGVDINLDFKKVAFVQQMGDSGKLYLYQLTSPSAYAIQVYFDAFKLPPGARMYFYDKDKTMFLGSFTSENNFVNNSFGTTLIKGNTAVIEYYEPNKVAFESLIHISKISHVFLNHGPFSGINFNNTDGWGASPCNINVNCELGYGWEREKKSVALILGQYNTQYIQDYNPPSVYFGFATGALINDVEQDGKPYFLTANHCLHQDLVSEKPLDDITNWIFLFNHETANCSDNGSAVSSNMSQSVYGAYIRSQEVGALTTDYLLLELNTRPDILKSYNVVYAGWETNEYNAFMSPFTVGIHHPAGDVKKISKDNNSPVSDSGSNYWNVSWDQGITEPGSSGSPLFNSSHKIIGQLYGGESSCSNPSGIDHYGKFSKSYENGFFKLWLDPNFTRVTSVGPYNPSQKGENCYNGDCGGDCPPCTWVMSAAGWGGNTLSNNHVMDKANGEIGIDCGGPNCIPCGGDAKCSDGIQDGDETDVDCGGSCIPCETYCQGQVIFDGIGLDHPLFSALSSVLTPSIFFDYLPDYTSVSNFIDASNSHVNKGQVVTFKSAGRITLKTGFSAKNGCTFKAMDATCDKCKKINAALSYSIITTELRINQSGADRYDITVYYGNSKIYSSSGLIYDKNPCLWDLSNVRNNAYNVIINLYNDCSGEKKTINKPILVVEPFNIKSIITSTNDIFEDDKNGISVYPNPSKGVVSIKNISEVPIKTINVYNSQGQNIIHQEYKQVFNLTTINLDRFTSGIYLIQIQTSNNLYTKSIILQK